MQPDLGLVALQAILFLEAFQCDLDAGVRQGKQARLRLPVPRVKGT